ncbi:MAG: hypothetical protein FWD68_14840 [Alphaproteobacteria bacterium]|nr:hypothetical protein [Alphaproteobacteria bacterium]
MLAKFGSHPLAKSALALLSALVLFWAYGAPASAQSLGDRFKSLFGGGRSGSPPPVPADGQDDMDCPSVTVRAGASTYVVSLPGKPAVGNDVRFQASISRLARECIRNGGDISVRIGIEGRVVAGPAGAPPTIPVPLRLAVVQTGIGEKVIGSKATTTTVEMNENGSVPFTVVEEMTYPVPSPSVADSYVFYVGFDPKALAPEPKARPKPRPKPRPRPQAY